MTRPDPEPAAYDRPLPGGPAPGSAPPGRGARPRQRRPNVDAVVSLGDSWKAVLIFGCVNIVVGFAVLAWPDATVQVVAVLFGLQILLYGVFSIVQAVLADDDAVGGRRLLLALLGVVALVVGVLALRNVMQTVLLLGLLLGLFWLVSGVLSLVGAVAGPHRPGRGVAALAGALSVLTGIVVLTYPDVSLVVLTAVLGIWLVVFGAVNVVIALQVRSVERASVPSPHASGLPNSAL